MQHLDARIVLFDFSGCFSDTWAVQRILRALLELLVGPLVPPPAATETEFRALVAEWNGFLVQQATLAERITNGVKRLSGMKGGRPLGSGGQTWEGEDEADGVPDRPLTRDDWNAAKERHLRNGRE